MHFQHFKSKSYHVLLPKHAHIHRLNFDTLKIKDHLVEMFRRIRNIGLSETTNNAVSDIDIKSFVQKIGGMSFPHDISYRNPDEVFEFNSQASPHVSEVLRQHFSIPFISPAPRVDAIASMQSSVCSGVSTFSSMCSSVALYQPKIKREKPQVSDSSR